MRNFKTLLLVICSSLLLIGCRIDDESGDFPINDPAGDYDYTSLSKYINEDGAEYRDATNQGAVNVRFSFDSTSGDLSATPIYGWAYDLDFTSVNKVEDSGVVYYVFRIPIQQIIVNNISYTVRGTGEQKVVDSNGNTLAQGDGVVKSIGEMVYEFESIEVAKGTSAITQVLAYKN